MVSLFKGRIYKLLIFPICTVINENDEPVKEEKVKPFTVFTSNLSGLSKTIKDLEDKLNDQYFGKIDTKTTNSG
jgi:hypothetical protein